MLLVVKLLITEVSALLRSSNVLAEMQLDMGGNLQQWDLPFKLKVQEKYKLIPVNILGLSVTIHYVIITFYLKKSS